MADQTPALVAAHATRPDAIDLRDLTLIGLMQAHDGPAALLRSSRGQIARVQTGAQVFGVTIAAIAGDQVLITNRWGQTETLAVAGS